MEHPLSRRAVLKEGALSMFAGLTAASAAEAAPFDTKPILQIGMITDLHYADTDDRGARNYRASLGKMTAAVEHWNRRHLDFAVHGGDLIDALPQPDPASERGFLQRIDHEFARLKTKRHYVLGNHCVYSLTKPEYLETIGRTKPYYSFDQGAFHFIVLDACCRKDGVDYGRCNYDWRDTEIPPAQRDWLARDLKATHHKTIVFVHQRLDLPEGAEDGIASSPAVREILEQSGKVIAVFMGHSHVNDYRTLNGIHYCTLDAAIGTPENGYSVLEVFADGNLRLEGFAKHAQNPLAQHAANEIDRSAQPSVS